MTLAPTPLDTESPHAFRVFREYVRMGKKRSIRAVARRCGINASLCSRWSAKHRWIDRLRELEMQAALQANEAARKADADAKAKFAERIEAARLRWTESQIKVAEKMTATALRMLEQPMKGNRPDDAAKLFSTANAIAATALGLNQGHGAPAMQPIARPTISLTVHHDGLSDYVSKLQYQFLKEHPEHAQSERLIREYEADREARGLPLDWPPGDRWPEHASQFQPPPPDGEGQ
jgi:hypothetical protein